MYLHRDDYKRGHVDKGFSTWAHKWNFRLEFFSIPIILKEAPVISDFYYLRMIFRDYYQPLLRWFSSKTNLITSFCNDSLACTKHIIMSFIFY